MDRNSVIKKFDLETYETLVAYNGDIVFEWDLVSDHFYTTPNLFDIFGYLPSGEGFGKAIENSDNIHPDDKHIISEYFKTIQYNFHDLKNKKHYSQMELRIRNAYNQFIWCKIQLAAHYSAQNLPYKISGMVTDIDFDKNQQEQLRQQASCDLLTGLYNKVTAIRRIDEVLKKADSSSAYALIVLDLDGFKMINDHFGHLFGDAVICDLAASIKHHFLNSDIVGRFGGDEFAIFTANIGTISTFKKHLAALVALLQRAYRSGDTEYKVSASIGIALYPAHGANCTALFANADQALYYIKNNGKGGYAFYRDKMPKMLHRPEPEMDEHFTAENKSFDENLPEYMIKILCNTADHIAALQMLLELLGKKFDVSRAVLFEHSAGSPHYVKTLEWHSREAAALEPGASEIPAALAESFFLTPALRRLHDCSDLNLLTAPQIAYCKSIRTQSFLYCPIVEAGLMKGYLGFDECRKERIWTAAERDILRFLADALPAFFLRKHTAPKPAAGAEDSRAKLLHAIDSALYIVDRYTHDILFVNNHLNQLLGAAGASGTKCHQLLHQRSQPCENCPMQKLGLTCRRAANEFYDKKRRRWFKCVATGIEWNNSPDCGLIQLYDITAQKDLEFLPMN